MHSIGDVGSCDDQVLQHPARLLKDEASSMSVSLAAEALGLVSTSGDRFAVRHAGAFQEIFGILGLRKEEATSCTSNADAEEVVN